MGAILFNDKAYPAGSNQASDSVYDNSNTGLPATTQGAIDKITSNIASANSVELTATAAHAHAVGTYFIWVGQLVKVTSAIAVGDTIADGTNVEATSIADVLTAANRVIEGKQDKLTNPLTQSDVVNTLTSTATNVPLSAAMGKALKDGLDGKSFSKGMRDLTWSTIQQTKPSGLYIVVPDCINSPVPGYWGQGFISYYYNAQGDNNRCFAILAFDNGSVWVCYSYGGMNWLQVK